MTGLLLVDKPAGPTSFDVLRRLRPALGRKLGHAGTLDPFATGLLLVLAGRATRLATFLSGLDKRYRATVQFGAVSSTLDPDGVLASTGATTGEQAVRAAAAAMVGSIRQRVPLASAVRVDGERSYARMRRGETEAPPAREVLIRRLEVVEWDDAGQRAVVEVECSKGTYVRQIAADLGEATGAGAHCAALRRLAVGAFTVDEAGTPEQVAEQPRGRWALDLRAALPHLPERPLDEDELADVLHGRPLRVPAPAGQVRLVHDGRLVAVADSDGARLRPLAVFGA